MCFFCKLSVKLRFSPVNFTLVLVKICTSFYCKLIYKKVPKFTYKSANCTEKSEVFMLSKNTSVDSRPFLYVKGFWPPAYFSFESIRHTCARNAL